MIPSFNRQNVKETDWPKNGSWPQTIEEYQALGYVCDCCRKHISFRVDRSMPLMGESHSWNTWAIEWNPRLVEVGGMTYYGCSTECARILFDIHHRYAQLKG